MWVGSGCTWAGRACAIGVHVGEVSVSSVCLACLACVRACYVRRKEEEVAQQAKRRSGASSEA